MNGFSICIGKEKKKRKEEEETIKEEKITKA